MEKIEPLHEASYEERFAYREQVTLAVEWEDGWKAGMRNRDAIIPVPDCPVHAPRVNKMIALILQHIPAIDSFPLHYVVQSGSQMSLVLKTASLPGPGWLTPSLCAELEIAGLQGLWLHLHPASGKKIFGKGGWHLIWGQPRSHDHNGMTYGPVSFRQLIPSLAEAALQKATDFLDPHPGTTVIDLYCGTGYSLRAWLERGARCAGVEWSAEALECAAVNAPGAFLLRGLCHQRIPQLNNWLGMHPQSASKCLYVNPPRTGLEAEVLQWICEVFIPDRIAYLSCSAGTLKRDLEYLAKGDYEVGKIIPYDFFPQTAHVECLSLLNRR